MFSGITRAEVDVDEARSEVWGWGRACKWVSSNEAMRIVEPANGREGG